MFGKAIFTWKSSFLPIGFDFFLVSYVVSTTKSKSTVN